MSRSNWQSLNLKSKHRPVLFGLALCLLGSLALPACAADMPPSPSPDPVPLKPLAPHTAPTAAPSAVTDKATAAGKAKAAGATDTVKPAAPAASAASTAPTAAAATAPSAVKPAGSMPPSAPSKDKLGKLSELEKVMFGVAQPNIPAEYRLDRLESEVFHQTNPDWDFERRIDRLNRTLLGGAAPAAPVPAGTPAVQPGNDPPAYSSQPPAYYYPPSNPYLPAAPGSATSAMPAAAAPPTGFNLPLPADANSPEFTKPLSREQLEQYSLDLVNEARLQVGLPPLQWDDLAHKVSKQLVADLCKRNTATHENAQGENPDIRYTKAGGSDCMVESVMSMKASARPVPNKQLVYGVIKELMSHQDDRDAVLNAHATHFGFTFDISSGGDKLLACAETVTRQGHVESIASQVHVGEKVDIKGAIDGPYKFQKITVAWEGLTSAADDSESQDEAAPYFPPLDYQAFARRSEHDFQKAQHWAQIAGIGLALAGGVFIPPVALAAPLIMAAPPAKPRAISEIPVHGGVHCEGNNFEFKMPLSKDNKEGIYYITIWVQSEVDQAPFAISRRAVIAKGSAEPQAEPKTSDDKTAESKGVKLKILTAKSEKKQRKQDKNGN